MKPTEGVTAEIVVQHVRALIERGELRPGDRLPPERELAVQLGVSRPSVRAGLRSLAAIGVLQTRHGAGTFITDGPPTLGSEPLSFLAALHGFTRDEMFEARRALEVGVAGLAAERATDDQIATIAEEVTGMFASLDDAQAFLIHDIRFHRAVAAASGNPDSGFARRDGVRALLRAAPEDRDQRPRPQAVGAGPPQHLPLGPCARRQAGALRHERAPVAGSAGPGPRGHAHRIAGISRR